MALDHLIAFNRNNKLRLFELLVGHLLWSLSLLVIFIFVRNMENTSAVLSVGLMALQLYFAGHLIFPVLRLQPENRSRGFYVFWGLVLALLIWIVHQLSLNGPWQLFLNAIQAGLLLMTGTIVGAALARYVRKLWEILPLCLAMSLADFSSWLIGPTANFAQTIEQYYLKPEGPPPAIDMILVKLAFPGVANLLPVFGLSDWIMVAFFIVVAQRHRLNDNLFGFRTEIETGRRHFGLFYLPVSLVALLAAVICAQTTGLFIPALPVIAVVMLLWFGGHSLVKKNSA
jgi:hypothetical protein